MQPVSGNRYYQYKTLHKWVKNSLIHQQVLARGVGLSTHSDSELITQALCLIPPEGEVNGPDWPARIRHLMQLAPLSYSLLLMLKDRIYAVRDPYGNRPLCVGRIVPSNSDRTAHNSLKLALFDQNSSRNEWSR